LNAMWRSIAKINHKNKNILSQKSTLSKFTHKTSGHLLRAGK